MALEEDEKTIFIRRIENVAPTIEPSFSQNFTEALRNRFVQQSSLKMVDRDADLEFSGRILRYELTPITITGNDQAAQTRLTIGIEVQYTNNRHKEKNWKQNFEQYADFSSDQNFASLEAQLLEDLSDRLTQDIFNKALANW